MKDAAAKFGFGQADYNKALAASNQQSTETVMAIAMTDLAIQAHASIEAYAGSKIAAAAGNIAATGVGNQVTRAFGGNTEAALQDAANQAVKNVGAGKGPVYGTRVHSEFQSLVENLGSDISTEVSYLNGNLVPHGTKGSVRLDAVVGDINKPSSVFDLKTGGARLTPKRINEIRQNLPFDSQNIPIKEVRPQTLGIHDNN